MLCQVIHRLGSIQPEIGHDGIQADTPSIWTSTRTPTTTPNEKWCIAIISHFDLYHLNLQHYDNLKKVNKRDILAGSHYAVICNAREITETCFHTLRMRIFLLWSLEPFNRFWKFKGQTSQNVPHVLLMFFDLI